MPNCSFEDTIACPLSAMGSIIYTESWYTCDIPESTSDYFVACGEYPQVPHNTVGFQYRASGIAYAGIITWFSYGLESRESICTELKTSLVIGQKYFVSFKVIAMCGASCMYASNKVGILFSTVEYSADYPAPIANFAHIYTNEIITDTANWTTISGWFIADTAYTYLTIRNFFDDANIDTIRICPYPGWYDTSSYIYIDDVCVSIDSTKCSCEEPISIKETSLINDISIYPNPASNFLQVKFNFPLSEPTKINIYNPLSILILEDNLKIV